MTIGDEPIILWAVYARPPGFPDHYVVRPCRLEHDCFVFEGPRYVFPSLEDARELLVLKGLSCLPPRAKDDPAIVETWL